MKSKYIVITNMWAVEKWNDLMEKYNFSYNNELAVLLLNSCMERVSSLGHKLDGISSCDSSTTKTVATQVNLTESRTEFPKCDAAVQIDLTSPGLKRSANRLTVILDTDTISQICRRPKIMLKHCDSLTIAEARPRPKSKCSWMANSSEDKIVERKEVAVQVDETETAAELHNNDYSIVIGKDVLSQMCKRAIIQLSPCDGLSSVLSKNTFNSFTSHVYFSPSHSVQPPPPCELISSDLLHTISEETADAVIAESVESTVSSKGKFEDDVLETHTLEQDDNIIQICDMDNVVDDNYDNHVVSGSDTTTVRQTEGNDSLYNQEPEFITNEFTDTAIKFESKVPLTVATSTSKTSCNTVDNNWDVPTTSMFVHSNGASAVNAAPVVEFNNLSNLPNQYYNNAVPVQTILPPVRLSALNGYIHPTTYSFLKNYGQQLYNESCAGNNKMSSGETGFPSQPGIPNQEIINALTAQAQVIENVWMHSFSGKIHTSFLAEDGGEVLQVQPAAQNVIYSNPVVQQNNTEVVAIPEHVAAHPGLVIQGEEPPGTLKEATREFQVFRRSSRVRTSKRYDEDYEVNLVSDDDAVPDIEADSSSDEYQPENDNGLEYGYCSDDEMQVTVSPKANYKNISRQDTLNSELGSSASNKFECVVCSKLFKQLSDLKIHLSGHMLGLANSASGSNMTAIGDVEICSTSRHKTSNIADTSDIVKFGAAQENLDGLAPTQATDSDRVSVITKSVANSNAGCSNGNAMSEEIRGEGVRCLRENQVLPEIMELIDEYKRKNRNFTAAQVWSGLQREKLCDPEELPNVDGVRSIMCKNMLAQANPLLCKHCPMHFQDIQSLSHHISRNHSTVQPVSERSQGFNLGTVQPPREKVIRHRQPNPNAPVSEKVQELISVYKTKNPDATASQILSGLQIQMLCEPNELPSIEDIKSVIFKNIRNKFIEVAEPTSLLCKCKYCKAEFANGKKLDIHYRLVHKTERPFKCSFCDKTFHRNYNLARHSLIHKEYMSCQQCQMSFQSRESLKQHELRAHSLVRRFECELCKKSFKSRTIIAKHMKLHTETANQSLDCKNCGIIFTSGWHLNKHRRREHKEALYKCNHCAEIFMTNEKLFRHKLGKHTSGTYTKICDVCGKTLSSYLALNAHRQNHNPMVYGCDKCDKKFKQKHHLINHKISHQVGNTHKCERCPKTFKFPHNFRYHMAKCTGK